MNRQHMSKAGFAQSKASSFASFVSGQRPLNTAAGMQPQAPQGPYATQAFPGGPTMYSGQPPRGTYHPPPQQRAPVQKRPCANPQCTPDNWEVPNYACDLDRGVNYCYVCWDAIKDKRFGLALSLEELSQIGVTSVGLVPLPMKK
ncbi:unnamed protein product, partial [Amoebophrya sp. A120]|eukprot:GSA120T00026002001.1